MNALALAKLALLLILFGSLFCSSIHSKKAKDQRHIGTKSKNSHSKKYKNI
jgi:hypothetical protein